MDDTESRRIWLCDFLRPAAAGGHHGPASYLWGDRGAASGGYGPEFPESADVGGDHRPGRRGAGISGASQKECKDTGTVHSKLCVSPVWHHGARIVRHQPAVPLPDHRRLHRRRAGRDRGLSHRPCGSRIWHYRASGDRACGSGRQRIHQLYHRTRDRHCRRLYHDAGTGKIYGSDAD